MRQCLNPCFVGMWSFRLQEYYDWWKSGKSLNPCFVGMWSFSFSDKNSSASEPAVLILVLLGCGLLGHNKLLCSVNFTRLNPCFVGMWSFSFQSVQIRQIDIGLNPCFVGMWSFRETTQNEQKLVVRVLILVLLGCGLLVNTDKLLMFVSRESLNPCFVGMWSFSRPLHRLQDSRWGGS